MEAFIVGVPAASIYAMCEGFKKVGAAPNEGWVISEELADARSLFLTPNASTVYNFGCIDLSKGPVVHEVPLGILGPYDDAYFRHVTDVGQTGPDQGKGGKYLLLPPGYEGPVPDGYFVVKPRTNTIWFIHRALVNNNDIKAAVYRRVVSIKQPCDLVKRFTFPPTLPDQRPRTCRVINARSCFTATLPPPQWRLVCCIHQLKTARRERSGAHALPGGLQ